MRNQLILGTLFFVLIFAFLGLVVAYVRTKRTQQLKGTFQPHMRVFTTKQELQLRNYHPFLGHRMRMVLNKEYVYTPAEIAPGATIAIPWTAFMRADGKHCTQRPAVIENLFIYAENVVGEYGSVELQHKPRT